MYGDRLLLTVFNNALEFETRLSTPTAPAFLAVFASAFAPQNSSLLPTRPVHQHHGNCLNAHAHTHAAHTLHTHCTHTHATHTRCTLRAARAHVSCAVPLSCRSSLHSPLPAFSPSFRTRSKRSVLRSTVLNSFLLRCTNSQRSRRSPRMLGCIPSVSSSRTNSLTWRPSAGRSSVSLEMWLSCATICVISPSSLMRMRRGMHSRNNVS